MALPSILTSDQISAFLAHIQLPSSLQAKRYSNNPIDDLHLLTQLHIHTISSLPYDNLWLHYSKTHFNTIAPETNFTNTVTNKRGRGGYCFQLSILFNHVLRGLGFPVYLSPVRVRPRIDGTPTGDYFGWVHLVNIVMLSPSQKYSIDIAFGGDGPTAPMPLLHNHPQTNLGTQQIRFRRDWLSTQLHRTEETKSWIFEYRNSEAQSWNAFYAFDDRVEAMEADFGNLNWYTGSHPEVFQTFTCVVVKFLRRRKEGAETDDEQEIYGKRMLAGGLVKENLGGRTQVVQECRTEEERVEALEKWFGIVLTEEEKKGIRGWVTELGNNSANADLEPRTETWHIKRGKGWSWDWKSPAEI